MASMSDTKTVSRSSPASILELRQRSSLWSRAGKCWSKIQVAHQGSYSIERLELLHEYCQTTSLARVFMVCLLTPIPALLVAVLLECLPLSPPSEGWEANWIFWIRHGLVTFVIFGVGSWQIDLFVSGHSTSRWQQLSLTVAVSVLQLATYVFEAAAIGFPVPFMWQFGILSMGIYIPVLTRLIYGPALFTKGTILQQRNKDFQDTVLINLIVSAVFPFCKVLYDLLPSKYHNIVVLVLPIWKSGAKMFAVRMSRQVEDFMPELVALSVDFFGSLFITACMSTSSSFLLTGLVLGMDFVHLLHKCHGFSSNKTVILRVFQDRKWNQDSEFKSIHVSDNGLVPMIVEAARDPSVTSLKRVRLWASPPHLISEQLHHHLKTLEASGKFGSKREFATFTGASRRMFRSASVVPQIASSSTHRLTGEGASAADNSPRGDNESGQLLRHGLQLLFQCEYLMLVEYIECVVPFVHVTYKSVLNQLPNAVYYSHVTSKWNTTTAANMIVFAALEVISLVLVELFLRRKFDLSPLHQLAFVLETQFLTVQASLFSLMLFTLQYQLAHLGVDFTFRFDWLR